MYSKASITVTCDQEGCGDNLDMQLTKTSGVSLWSAREITISLTHWGWKVIGDEHYCPRHAKKRKEEAEQQQGEASA
jgi:hypothetical protein